MYIKQLGTLILVVFGAVQVKAQDMNALWEDGAFDVARSSIEALEPVSRRDQIMAVWMTMVGREDLQATIERPVAGEPMGDCIDKTEAQIAEWVSAESWLLQEARTRRVLMFNENHYRVGARALVLEMLPQLRELGFTHVGFEAFPVLEDSAYGPAAGFYTHEPIFAALVRKAQELGFVVFGYESSESAPEDADVQAQIAFREQAQAENLVAALNDVGEQARFVIFAGWSHIAKAPLRGGQRWMASRFRERSGIDPLTVDLTTCTYPRAGDGGIHDARLPLGEGGQPIVIGHYAGAVDAQVHMPVPKDTAGSAGFFRQVLGQQTAVPEALLPTTETVLIRARRVDRDSSAVPDDQVMMNPGEILQLYLPGGHEYEITSHGGDGRLIGRQTMQLR